MKSSGENNEKKENKEKVDATGFAKASVTALTITTLFIALLLSLWLLVSCRGLVMSKSQTPESGSGNVEVEIKEGMTLKEIAQLLEEKGVIDSSFFFRLYVQQEGKEKSLMPGTYILKAGSDYKTVLDEITKGPPIVTYKLIIPEGYTVSQIANRILNDIPFIQKEDVEDAINISKYDYPFLEGVENLEGFLFPKTYEITEGYTAEDIIEMMLVQYQLETSNLDYTFAQENGFSPYEILIIASMIEREAYVPEERELISAVIYNRLKKDMPLGIDATIRYVLDKWDEDLTVSDLNIDSPYNTRIYTGLPPTPICNPGLDSIRAALAPADVDYLYYVITDQEKHTHSFSSTYEEHQKNIQKSAYQNGSSSK
ncbi:MAG: endolytic transglycosylase MltG [Actinobacteria bacterium]|nr:endolytic transglycosylase MltG [Actinomycetota bacterium]